MANATTSLLDRALAEIPVCASDLGGFCIEQPSSGKGVVLFDNFNACSFSFINLPGINLVPTWLLVVMWGLFLIWVFFGVAVISDAFVENVEVICSSTRMFKRKDARGNDVYREEPVWNWAVANITLLAVGTSSPEILLALVETLRDLGKEAGEIGPSCIVGSAAYNFLIIIAVCTVSLPAGVFKKIEHTKVFMWTTSWSLWAYVWIWLVYKAISPNSVEVWEAFVTLGFMPLFVWSTWMVDTRGWNWLQASKNAVVPDDELEGDPEDPKLSDRETPRVSARGSAHARVPKLHSIMYYRQLAVQRMAGFGASSLKNIPLAAASAAPMEVPTLSCDSGRMDAAVLDGMARSVTKVLFKSAEMSVLESQQEAIVQVMRMHGDVNSTVTVNYTCKDDTAVSGLDYEPCEGQLVFGPGEMVKEIVVKIVDDDMSEPDVQFSVFLKDARVQGGGDIVVLRSSTIVTIVDDDDSGVITFQLPTWEAGSEDPHAKITVIRRNGTDGKVSVEYATQDGQAIAGKHFESTSGTLVFSSGETIKHIFVPLLPVDNADLITSMLAFRLTLANPSGGAVLGLRKDCRVIIAQGSKISPSSATSPEEGDGKEASFNLWSAWEKQFQDAILPEYDPDEGVSVWMAIVLHYISITFKLLSACIPPAQWRSGYPGLLASLAMLGALMSIVQEVAEQFGCAVGLSALMNGMSIVALGTSLPDTYASRMAAINDDTADAAIGNVMGSNAVNVFLGLGIPWVIASVYYEVKGQIYQVKAGALGFSIVLFAVFMLAGMCVVLFRRRQGGELGGSTRDQWITFALLSTMWLLFLTLSGLQDYGHIDSGSL